VKKGNSPKKERGEKRSAQKGKINPLYLATVAHEDPRKKGEGTCGLGVHVMQKPLITRKGGGGKGKKAKGRIQGGTIFFLKRVTSLEKGGASRRSYSEPMAEEGQEKDGSQSQV